MHLVCPRCAAVNRVPEARLGDTPVCGKCSTELMAAVPMDIDDRVLPTFLEKTELPVVVDFWAAWCGPCKMMAPQFATAAKQQPKVRFIKVDTEACPGASARHAIRSIPTQVLFVGGHEVARVSGAMSAPDIANWIRSHTG